MSETLKYRRKGLLRSLWVLTTEKRMPDTGQLLLVFGGWADGTDKMRILLIFLVCPAVFFFPVVSVVHRQ